jgi:hypothetical protein
LRCAELSQKERAFRSGRGDFVARDAAPNAKDDVECVDRRTRRPDRLAQLAPQPIAIDGAAHRLARDDEADAPRRLRGGRRDQLQELGVVPRSPAKERFERLRAAKAVTGEAAVAARVANAGQTESRARPFARRAERTLRPPTVFMRARKPCVRARRIFDGWKVRFIA